MNFFKLHLSAYELRKIITCRGIFCLKSDRIKVWEPTKMFMIFNWIRRYWNSIIRIFFPVNILIIWTVSVILYIIVSIKKNLCKIYNFEKYLHLYNKYKKYSYRENIFFLILFLKNKYYPARNKSNWYRIDINTMISN